MSGFEFPATRFNLLEEFSDTFVYCSDRAAKYITDVRVGRPFRGASFGIISHAFEELEDV